ncbi:methyltransferase domain-containing protein [Desulfurococcaceae archaeon MEX13E-LK6-19]|nr:methyltransferase domain-containing protein [Desulfurococcaceae archaeon MEX13E-LK6-19]
MLEFSLIMSILLWIFAIIIIWIVFVEVIIRILRHYIHFPVPVFIGRFIDNPIRRRIQSPSKVVGWIDIKNGMLALEIGPGPGTFTIEAAKRAGSNGRIVAIDIEPIMIFKLRDKLRRNNIFNVEPIVGSALDLPFRERVFDRVFMVAVFGELPNKEKALLEIKRVIKDEGLLAIGEFLPDPDCPRRKTVIKWCAKTGFRLVNKYGHLLHYLLIFRKKL